jgi:hypothetical protein
MFKELDSVIAVDDIPSEGIKKGDTGAVVSVYRHGELYEVEFTNENAITIAVATVTPEQIKKRMAASAKSVTDIAGKTA